MVDILITGKPIDTQACINMASSPHSGGIDVFIGTVRAATKGKEVVRLEFEAYRPMAVSEIKKITAQMLQKWPLHHIIIHHRTGILKVGDIAVVIVVSAAHRDAAFDACRYAINTLKQTVPIWKKEVFLDGEEWVAAHP
ncbi:MAG: molybdenum cofactor biosynthesis protein MoaE [Flavipsychrobacter sp.]|nr:molybdenum cofactor biosynthesis protein MoaE [Flavipsychrobacter sp.]